MFGTHLNMRFLSDIILPTAIKLNDDCVAKGHISSLPTSLRRYEKRLSSLVDCKQAPVRTENGKEEIDLASNGGWSSIKD
jgi:hypothetical protein